MDFVSFLFTDVGMTQSGHVILLLFLGLLYRRVNRLEKQLVKIAAHTGEIAALFEYDIDKPEPPALDGREP